VKIILDYIKTQIPYWASRLIENIEFNAGLTRLNMTDRYLNQNGTNLVFGHIHLR